MGFGPISLVALYPENVENKVTKFFGFFLSLNE